MIRKTFTWIFVPLAIVAMFWLIENQMDERRYVILTSFASGFTLGLYIALCLRKQREKS